MERPVLEIGRSQAKVVNSEMEGKAGAARRRH